MGKAVMTHVQVLYFDGCPNHEALLPRLRQLLREAGIGDEIELLRVEDDEAAQRERFLGSPRSASTARTLTRAHTRAATTA